tara:strand:- start:178 stop:609 length:432 start_codon:yes stop_codon:yes gene_type:complete
MGEETTFSLDRAAYKIYSQSFIDFLDAIALSKEVKLARKFILKRYEKSINAISSIDNKEATKAVRALQFTNEEIYRELVKKFGDDKFISSIGRPVVLKEMATYFSTIDINVALRYVERALEIHPKAPQIIDLHKRLLQQAKNS